MKKSLSFWIVFSLLLLTSEAYAAGDEIFDTLADIAGTIGGGLGGAGFMIAGFGLAVFSFMALFNKISWKTLAYIMMSTFILSVMTLIISEASDGKATNLSFGGSGAAAPGNAASVPARRGGS